MHTLLIQYRYRIDKQVYELLGKFGYHRLRFARLGQLHALEPFRSRPVPPGKRPLK